MPARRWRTRVAAAIVAAVVAGGDRAAAEGSAPGGLRGLLRVRSADTAGHGALEAGFFSAVHALDDTTGASHWFSVTHLQAGYGVSPYLELGVALPVRAFTVSGGRRATGVPRRSAGFGDLGAAVKMQVPIPGRLFRLGLLGDATFGTGSRSRGFSSESSDVAAGGLMTFDLSRIERFPPTRVHLNILYRWNRNEIAGFGLAPLDDVRGGGFWPPAYPPAGDDDQRNDQMLWRMGFEVSTRVATLFTEVAFDDHPSLDVPKVRQNPWILTQGALVKFRNGLNLKAAADVSLQRDDAPATLPELPDWRFTVGLTWRAELSLGDRDHDGVSNEKDQCPEESEDHDGFQDDDGCPDLDNDLDGVPDARDRAPSLPEDVDGFEDQDGRPDLDNDDDGIRDADDACVNEAEDYDGDQDADGCPDGPARPAPEGESPPGVKP